MDCDFNVHVSYYRPLARIGNVYFAQEKYVEAIAQFQTSLVENFNSTVKEKMQKAEKILKENERLAYINPEIGEEERQKGNEFFKSGNFINIFTSLLDLGLNTEQTHLSSLACVKTFQNVHFTM